MTYWKIKLDLLMKQVQLKSIFIYLKEILTESSKTI